MAVVGIPVAGEIRQARAEVARVLGPSILRLRAPALVVLGGAEAALVEKLTRMSTSTVRAAQLAPSDLNGTYDELLARGEDRLYQIGHQHEVSTTLGWVTDALCALNRRVEITADALNDLSEETLARIELRTHRIRARAIATLWTYRAAKHPSPEPTGLERLGKPSLLPHDNPHLGEGRRPPGK